MEFAEEVFVEPTGVVFLPLNGFLNALDPFGEERC
jgi:hypothetical protein